MFNNVLAMFNSDYVTKKDIKERNPNWPENPDHPYRMLIVGGSGSEKINALITLINYEPNIDKIFYIPKIHTKQNINY